MNQRPDRNTAVSPAEIENREDGPALGVDHAAALRVRIEAARRVEPKPGERHCVDCFNRGRDAAIRAILGE